MIGWLVFWSTLLPLACSFFLTNARHPAPAKRRRAGIFLALFILPFVLLFAIPEESWGPMGGSFLLNVRALALLPLVGAMAAAQSPWLNNTKVHKAVGLSLVLVCAFTVAGVTRLGRAYSAEVDDFEQKSAVLPAKARLAIEVKAVHVRHEWPPIRQSMGVTIFSKRLSLTTGMFINDHIPVHDRQDGYMVQLQADSNELHKLLQSEAPDCARIHSLWGRFDGMFVESETLDPEVIPPPEYAKRLAFGRKWYLLGPPSSPCG